MATTPVAYAEAEGRDAGKAAASWIDVDETNAARILKGFADGDLAFYDTLPYADLSGQWADTLTGPQLVADALDAAGIDVETADFSDWLGEVADAYEAAFGEAVEADLTARARWHVGEDIAAEAA